MKDRILRSLSEAESALTSFINHPANIAAVEAAAQLIVQSFQAGHKALSIGNGGSMCDAMHFAEELVGRYRADRPSLPAVAASDPSFLTCAANDYGYEFVFSRFVEGIGKPGDVLLAISTSGMSPSIVNAAKVANGRGVSVIALTGRPNSPLSQYATVEICCQAGDTADRVQELHIKVIHILIELIEVRMGFAN